MAFKSRYITDKMERAEERRYNKVQRMLDRKDKKEMDQWFKEQNKIDRRILKGL